MYNDRVVHSDIDCERFFTKTVNSIKGLSESAIAGMKSHLDSLTKPLGSLGLVEDLAIRLAGIYGSIRYDASDKAVIVMAADNGVVEEGVSSCPKDVTATVTENFCKGFTAINVFCRYVKSRLVIIDIGVDADIALTGPDAHSMKVMRSTGNIARGPAMSRPDAFRAIAVGIDAAQREADRGVRVLGTGEMGIGNTTTSSAMLAALTGLPPAAVTGRGAGLSDSALARKLDVVGMALDVNQPARDDAIDVISKVGGLDIAGLVGVFLGGASRQLPVVIDGFISGVAALAASRLCPAVTPYMIPSHVSAEPGTAALFEALDMQPPLHLGMRLGEGTGAALAFTLIDLCIRVVEEMGTFPDAGICQYIPQED